MRDADHVGHEPHCEQRGGREDEVLTSREPQLSLERLRGEVMHKLSFKRCINF